MAVQIINADVLAGLAQLEDESVQCCVTSPPYWGLRDYGHDGQIGLEATPDEFVAKMVEVFAEVRRVLRKDGTLWLNLGDSYNNFRSSMGPGQAVHGRDKLNGKPAPGTKTRGVSGLKEKDLVGIPWAVAFALRSDGWYLRQEIIWQKPNPMPESVRDRCTKAHEHIFLLSKSERYWFDAEAIKEDAAKGYAGSEFHTGKTAEHQMGRASALPRIGNGRKDLRTDIESRHRSSIPGGQSLQSDPDGRRNKRSVWSIATQPYADAHFATFPEELPEICIKAGSKPGDTILDPFGGAGTTGLVADKLGRNTVLIELNPEYATMAERRISGNCPMFSQVSVFNPSARQSSEERSDERLPLGDTLPETIKSLAEARKGRIG